MENIPELKELVCLLSCQPRDMENQLPVALDCLRNAINADAVGIIWVQHADTWQSTAQSPPDFDLPAPVQAALTDLSQLVAPSQGQDGFSWLAVPMKVSGVPIGRLWAIDRAPRHFQRDEQEFIMMMGNQLALALENSRLYADVTRLAARRAELLRRVIATQDERCRRISRDLHDEISQSLAALAMDVEALHVARLNPRQKALDRLVDIHPRLVEILQEVNRIILDLRPTLLEDLGLLPALEWFARQRLTSPAPHIFAKSHPAPLRLPATLETTLYRIGQEAITNIAKHAQAQTVWLKLEQLAGSVSLTVRDDGRGFELASILSHTDDRIGLGLFGMKERANLVGGDFLIQSEPNEGTSISVTIPLSTEEAPAYVDSRLAG